MPHSINAIYVNVFDWLKIYFNISNTHVLPMKYLLGTWARFKKKIAPKVNYLNIVS